MARWAIAAAALAIAVSSDAAVKPCAPLAGRVANLRRVLATDWLKIRPSAVAKAWYRHLDDVPVSCYVARCLYLGAATNLPDASELKVGECSESFTFSAEKKGDPMLLGGAALSHQFATLAEALEGAEMLSHGVQPPDGACQFLFGRWNARERARECDWAAEGDWVINVSIRIIHHQKTWEAEMGIGRMQH